MGAALTTLDWIMLVFAMLILFFGESFLASMIDDVFL